MSNNAFDEIKKCLDDGESFVLEAGAGSGKTFTLIQTLNYILEIHSTILRFNRQKIVCITYTNVAKNEIINRLEHNVLVEVLTIHEFLWSNLKQYQKQLRNELCNLNEIRYAEEEAKKAELTGAKFAAFEHKYVANLKNRIGDGISIDYQDTSFRDFDKGLLHHDDVITIARMMFEKNKLLANILSQRYPYIFLDEYQDSAPETVESFIDFVLGRHKDSFVLGFYGDSHQKIYNTGVGDLNKYIEAGKIKLITKKENYRSSKAVVSLLNNFRKNIVQNPIRTENGSVNFIYCNNYPAKPQKGITIWEKDIEPQKNLNYEKVIHNLIERGWNFGDKSPDKILVIANSRVAKRAGFGDLYTIFTERYGQSAKDSLINREHPLIRFFSGYIDKKTSQEREVGLEHLYGFWAEKKYNQVYRFLKYQSHFFSFGSIEHSDKVLVNKLLNELEEKRNNCTVGQLFEFVKESRLMFIPESLKKFIDRISEDLNNIEDEIIKGRILKDKALYDKIFELPYSVIKSFFTHIQNQTVFSTKHGTKGEEYRNVLTVIDDTEWKAEYNFEKFFDNSDDSEERKLRTRNLFYVECSRAKDNLVVLALSPMDNTAMREITAWFGVDSVVPIDKY